jgi:Carboxypeptidase regulatory-like domain
VTTPRRPLRASLLALVTATAATASLAAAAGGTAVAAPAAPAAPAVTSHSARAGGQPAPAVPAARPAALGVPTALGVTHQTALGTITGIVLGADGQPLARACVTATGPGGAVPALAGPGGQYAVRELRPGAYTVSYADCLHPARYFEQWSGGSALAADAARVTVRPGQVTRLAPVTMRLTSPAAELAASQRATAADPARATDLVTGIVRNRAGRPLAGICVIPLSPQQAAPVKTGRDGRYRLRIGTRGTWGVRFAGGCGNRASSAPQWWRRRPSDQGITYLHAAPGRSFRGIDATLRPGAAITGIVRAAGSGHQPLPGICVLADGMGALRQVQFQTVTGPGGRYRVPNLGTGRYQLAFFPYCGQKGDYLYASYPRPVAVTDGHTTRNVSVGLVAGAELRGTVTSAVSHAPLSGICVVYQQVNGPYEDFAMTSRAGTYSLTQMTRGRYQVGFAAGCGSRGSYAPQYYLDQSSAAGATVVSVATGQVRSGINAALTPGATISGTLTSTAGHPLPGVCVLLTPRSQLVPANPIFSDFVPTQVDLLAYLGGLSDQATTGPAGGYRFTSLPPDQYRVGFSGGCGHGSVRYESATFAPQGGTGWVSASGGRPVTGVSAVLRPGGHISGVISGADGRRLGGICAEAFTRRDVATLGALDASFVGTATSSRRGTYRIGGLASGRYTVLFGPCGSQRYALQWYRRQADPGTATFVPIRVGRTTPHINAALVRGGTVTGRVVSGATGRPVRGACVLVGTAAGIPTGFALTSRTGTYRVATAAAGHWVVEAAPCLSIAQPTLGSVVRPGLRVRNGAVTRAARLVLPRPGQISGTVTGGTPAGAEPGLCAEARSVSGRSLGGVGVTGPAGRYVIPALAPGRYQVLFTPACVPGSPAVTPGWFGGATGRATGRAVTVRAGATTGGVGTVLTADGGIAGSVRRDGTAVPGVCVGAYPGSSPAPAAIAETGPGGSYLIGQLPAGRYEVRFTAGCGVTRYAARWYRDATSRSGATPVMVMAGTVARGISAG